MNRRWSFLPLRSADAGGAGGGAADAGAAAAAADAGSAAAGAATGDAGAAAAVAAAGTPAPIRPDWLPEDQWDATSGKPKVDVAEALKAHQTAAERAGQVPAEASGYKVVLPEGSALKIDEADPLLAATREWAKAEGLTQKQFEGLLGLRAKMDADFTAAVQAAAQAEVKKLGDKAPERISTVTQFLSSKLPAAQFEAIKGAVQTAAGVEAVETLMTLASGQKLPGGSQPASEAVSEVDYFKSLFKS